MFRYKNTVKIVYEEVSRWLSKFSWDEVWGKPTNATLKVWGEELPDLQTLTLRINQKFMTDCEATNNVTDILVDEEA